MSEHKNCSICKNAFDVEDVDLQFYQSITPTFAGREYPIPSPSLCPDCRFIRRLLWRNENKLYKRKSDKSGKEVVSIFAPDSPCVVYAIDEWWADDWDAMQYGQEYNPDRSFFEQFNVLYKKVPRLALINSKTENCEYVNYTSGSKNCYMSSVIHYNTENTHYSYWAYRSVNNVSIIFADQSEDCYFSYNLVNTYNCKYSVNLTNCRDCTYCFNLNGCNNCLFSSNLTRKKYYVRNQKVTPEEYELELQNINTGSWQSFEENYAKFLDMKKHAVVKYANFQSCEDCDGDDMVECKNVRDSFGARQAEDCRFYMGGKAKYAYDAMGGDLEWALETHRTGFGSVFVGCSSTFSSSFMYYCDNCYSCSECFGCVGLRNKKYCIFNKQYDSREEYETKVGEIVQKMIERGEWGEFFPVQIAPFAYDESATMRYFPTTKEKAIAFGARWKDIDSVQENFNVEVCKPNDDISFYRDNEQEVAKLLNGVLCCKRTRKYYKISASELAFYIKANVPIPRYHYFEILNMVFENQRPPVLHEGRCMCENAGACDHRGRCAKTFKTNFAPDCTEKVYCETCFQNYMA